jgi:magnesium chelatase family protein
MGKVSLISQRPFRAPHHSVSSAALLGGGAVPQPGEISLAHNGVLFLDELPEFPRNILEAMRQPLEDQQIHIARSKFSVEFPANFMLVASMNPCPCGFYTHPEKDCTCGTEIVEKYLNKISGPLLDRMDLHVEVSPVKFEQMTSNQSQEGSWAIRERVILARKRQEKRFEKYPQIHANAAMSSPMVKTFCGLDAPSQLVLKKAMDHLKLSARAYDRILKVARTIADLDGAMEITNKHLAEAISYRSLDRENWAG